MLKFLGLIFSVLLSIQSVAQVMNNHDSEYLIATGNSLVENGRFLEALTYYDHVSHNDSNYIKAQGKKAMALFYAQRYKQSVETAQYGLKISNGDNLLFYDAMANSYFRLQDYLKASEIFRKTTEEYPYNANAQLKLAMVEMQLNKISSATSAFQRTIELNFVDDQAHFLLGHLLAESGRSSAAILSMTTAILLSQDSVIAKSAYDVLERVAKISFPKQIPAAINALEDEMIGNLEIAIENKSVESKLYRKVRPKDIVAKQLLLICESFSETENSFNFWTRNYAPFFKQISTEKLQRALFYKLKGKTSNDKKTNVWLKKHSSELARLDHIWKSFVVQRQETIFEMASGKLGSRRLWFTPNAKIYAVGNASGEGENIIREGYWHFVDINGKIAYGGAYANNQKTGRWCWFYTNNSINRTIAYTNGIKNDTLRTYYPDGTLKETAPYQNNKLNGEYKRYSTHSVLTALQEFKNGVQNGDFKLFYPNGNKQIDYHYSNGKIDGLCFEFYDTGTKSSEKQYDAGQLNGPIHYFHANGKTAMTGQYAKGFRTGKWQWFYESGSKKNIQFYNQAGEKDSISISFHENGKIEEKRFYQNGKLQGKVEGFFSNGQKLYEYTYENGKLVSYSNYDLNGKLISKNSSQSGKLRVTTTYPDGTIEAKGEYVNGEKHGIWQYFYSNQKLSRIHGYEFGKLHGESKEYFADGKPKSTTFYNQGMADGQYKSFYRNDSIKEIGYYENDKPKGSWQKYYPNGVLKKEEHYANGELHGYQFHFHPDGNLTSQYLYNEGTIISVNFYDTKGEQTTERKFIIENEAYTSFYPNGKKRMTASVKNGQLHGEYKIFFPNGTIQETGTMVYGQNHGLTEIFYPNKKKNCSGNYSFGEKSGKWVFYAESGKKAKTVLHNGNFREVKTYFPNGKLRERSNFKNEIIDGYSYLYNRSGKLICRKYYRDGVLLSYTYPAANGKLRKEISIDYENNELKTYFSNKKLALHEKYDDGYIDSIATEYLPNGVVIRKTSYKYGKKHGLEQHFYPNGLLKSSTQFYYGLQNGEHRAFSAKKQIELEANYLMGDLHGDRKVYKAGKIKRKEKYNYGILEVSEGF